MTASSDPQVVRIVRVAGRALPMRGDDIDTDRIMPARFLRAVTFAGLEAHLFEDDRRAARGQAATHPFDDPRFRGASVLVVGRNFGCGSSREHAPQAIARSGCQAIVGVSFGGIFLGNATSLGLPCVSMAASELARLMDMVEEDPATEVSVDLEVSRVVAGPAAWAATLPDSTRQAFMDGSWDATAALTSDFHDVEAAAARLPYIVGF